VRGKVLWFDNNKGYGFIRGTEKEHQMNQDIYFHWTAIEGDGEFKTVNRGQPVEFELRNDADTIGYQASKVKPLPYINEDNGKPLILAAFFHYGRDVTLDKFQIEIGSKEVRGVKYLYFNTEERYVLALSEPISKFSTEELVSIVNAIISSDDGTPRKVIEMGEEFSYDILWV
jgi:CspA family cold shock protein